MFNHAMILEPYVLFHAVNKWAIKLVILFRNSNYSYKSAYQCFVAYQRLTTFSYIQCNMQTLLKRNRRRLPRDLRLIIEKILLAGGEKCCQYECCNGRYLGRFQLPLNK